MHVYLATFTVSTGQEFDEFVTGWTRVYHDIDAADGAIAKEIRDWFPQGIGQPSQRPVGQDQQRSRWGVYEHLTEDLGVPSDDMGAEIVAGSITTTRADGIVSHSADIADDEDMVSYGITRTQVLRAD